MNKNEIIETIFNTLQRQKFHDWYEGDFADFIGGNMVQASPLSPLHETKIREEIVRLFKL